MRKYLLALFAFFLFFSTPMTSLVAAQPKRDLIDVEDMLKNLKTQDFDGNVLSDSEAEAIIDTIATELENNIEKYRDYTLYENMVRGAVPGNRMTAIGINLAVAFEDYRRYLLDQSQAKSDKYDELLHFFKVADYKAEEIDEHADYSVDISGFDNRSSFVLTYPSGRFLEIGFPEHILNYQGNIYGGTANYEIEVQEVPNRQLSIYNWDGSGVRNVNVSTNVKIIGISQHYHRFTDEAYLFHNADGGISLAMPDFDNLLLPSEKPLWVEYRLNGNYDGVDLRPYGPHDDWTVDLSLPWVDVMHSLGIVSLDTVAFIDSLRDTLADPVLNELRERSKGENGAYDSSRRIDYGLTFVYADYLGELTEEQTKILNHLRYAYLEPIYFAETERREERQLKTPYESIIDQLHFKEYIKEDPILMDLLKQISIVAGRPFEAYEYYDMHVEDGKFYAKVMPSVWHSQPDAWEYYLIELDTRDMYQANDGQNYTLIEKKNILNDAFPNLEFEDFTPGQTIPSDYQPDPGLLAVIVQN